MNKINIPICVLFKLNHTTPINNNNNCVALSTETHINADAQACTEWVDVQNEKYNMLCCKASDFQ